MMSDEVKQQASEAGREASTLHALVAAQDLQVGDALVTYEVCHAQG